MARLTVQVVPNAKKSEVVGEVEDALRIRLKAQPIEGRANEELVRFLAKQLGLPKSAVDIAQGASARRKVVEVHCPQGRDSLELRRILLESVAGSSAKS